MISPDRDRGFLTTDDRDYLAGRKNLESGSERNTRRRIRNRVKNAIYDFKYLASDFEERDVTQLSNGSDGPNEDLFEAAEDGIAFIFRMCALASESPSKTTKDRFREVLRNGIEKGLNERQELLDFKLDLQYGLPREQRARLLKKIREGKQLTVPELREAMENDYFDDSYRFKALDSDGMAKNVNAAETRSHDDYL
jgi:hypothetical protein